MDSLNVFISSTWLDMMPEREAVEHVVHRLRSINFIGMEYFGSRNETTEQVSLKELERCQIYIGILGHRYGSGITEAEYRHAAALGLPCLIYLKDGVPAADTESERDSGRMASLRRELEAKHTVTRFGDEHDLTTRLIADIHNVVFERLIVQGVDQLPTDFDSRIQRFVAEYIGTSEAPIAFGGRESELEALDRWLDNPHAPPYAMVGGPAGRGKSALLVHWAQRLALRADISLIYFPVSIRFRTNLATIAFSSISARLAALHDDTLPANQDISSEVWRELMSTYLHRKIPGDKRFVIIIDGIDESADWQPGPDLFPAAPSPGLKVLVSARYLAGDIDARGWMARLGWDHPMAAYPLDLSPLTPQGLIDVLHQMSLPLDKLSIRADIVAELFRLTAGDPLLVNLYVADLWTRGEEVARLQPEDLAAIRSGIDGYFRRWWDDQRMLWGAQSPLREPAANEILNTLACALGPLHTSELLELLPSDSSVEFWALDDIMHALQRFVIGDGDTQGYTFSHPRLADYFYDRLAKSRRAREHEMRFVSWGFACFDELDSKLRAPAEVPLYLLQYLRAHMERMNSDTEVFVKLVSNAWALAWEQLDKGSYAGFLADVLRVQELVIRDENQYNVPEPSVSLLAAEIRCALYKSSIITLESEMSIDLIKVLVNRDIWSPAQAISYSTRISDRHSRLKRLLALTTVLAPTHRPLSVAASLSEIRTLLDEESGRAVVTATLHSLLSETIQTSTATEVARVLEAVVLPARQLDQQQQSRLINALLKCLQSIEKSAEQEGIIQHVLAQCLEGSEAAHFHARAKDTLAEIVSNSSEVLDVDFAADRLSLLQSALENLETDDVEPYLRAALQAASKALTAVAATNSTTIETVWKPLLNCWRHLPPYHTVACLKLLAPRLTDHHIHQLLEDIAGWKNCSRSQIDALAILQTGVPMQSRTHIASKLDAMIRDHVVKPNIYDLTGLVNILRPDTLAFVIDQTDNAFTSIYQIETLYWLMRSRPEPQLRTQLTELALNAVSQWPDEDSCLLALAILFDWLEPGSIDSFEPWLWLQSEKSRGVGYYPDREWDWLLALRFRNLLVLGKASCAQVWTTIQHLGNRLLSNHVDGHSNALRDKYDWLPNRIMLVAKRLGFAVDEKADEPTTDELAVALTERYRILDLGADELAQAVMQTEPQPGFADTLSILGTLATTIPPNIVRQSIAFIMNRYQDSEVFAEESPHELARIPSIVASGLLYPPENDTLAGLQVLAETLWSHPDRNPELLDALLHADPMPNVVRHELLTAALRHNPEDTLVLLLDIGRLVDLPDDTVDLVLSKLRESENIAYASRERIIKHLMPFIKRIHLPRWLSEIDSMRSSSPLSMEMNGLLLEFKKTQFLDDDSYWKQILDVVGSMRPLTKRAKWIVSLAVILPESVISDAIALANGIDDDSSRLHVQCNLLPLLPNEKRTAALTEALALSRRMEETAEISRALVQMAVDLRNLTPALLDEATAAAIAIPDKDLRGSALAELSTYLQDDALISTALVTRRLNDTAARLRAMKACAASIMDPRQRQTAIKRILASIDTIPADGAQASAILYVSPMLDPLQRWPMLDTALQPTTGHIADFNYEELLAALCEALVNAPAQIVSLAFNWFRHVPATLARSRTLAELFPSLPTSLLLPAIVMISEKWNEEFIAKLAPYVSPQLLAQTQKHERRLPQSARKTLTRIAYIRATSELPFDDLTSLSAPSTQPIDALLSGVTGEIQRASVLQRLSLTRDISAPCRRRIIYECSQLNDSTLRASTTRYVAALCANRSLVRARDAVSMIESTADRSLGLFCLALRHHGPMRCNLMEQALAEVQSETEPVLRCGIMAEIAIAEPALLPTILDYLKSISQIEAVVRALREMILRFSVESSVAVVRASSSLLVEERYGRLMMDMAASLASAATEEILATLPTIKNNVTRARLLVSLVPQIGNDRLPSCVGILDRIETDYAWIEALGAMTVRWPSALTHERAIRAIDSLLTIGDEYFSVDWLSSVIVYWPEPSWPDFFKLVDLVRDPGLRCDLLCAVPLGPDKLLSPDFLSLARNIDSAFFRCVVLGYAGTMQEKTDDTLLREVLRTATNLGRHTLYIDILEAIVETSKTIPVMIFEALLTELNEQAPRIVQAIRNQAQWLQAHQAIKLLQGLEATNIRSRQLTPTAYADLLFDLAPQLASENLPYLFQHVSHLGCDRTASTLLCDLAPFIADDASQENAVAAALSIQESTFRTQGLIGIAEYLNPYRQQELIALLEDTPFETERLRRLAVVWPKLASDTQLRWFKASEQFNHEAFNAILKEHIDSVDRGDIANEAQLMQSGNSLENDDSAVELHLDSLLNELLSNESPIPSSSANEGSKFSTYSTLRIDELVNRLDNITPEADRFEQIEHSLSLLSPDELIALADQLRRYLSAVHEDDVLIRLFALLPTPARKQLLPIINRSGDLTRLKRLLPLVIDYFDNDMREMLRKLLSDAVSTAGTAQRSRRELLRLIETWAPGLAWLGGDSALLQTIDSISDVGILWP